MHLTDMQLDALREMANVGSGNAATSRTPAAMSLILADVSRRRSRIAPCMAEFSISAALASRIAFSDASIESAIASRREFLSAVESRATFAAAERARRIFSSVEAEMEALAISSTSARENMCRFCRRFPT